jgi:hypothetical protein
MDNFLLFIEKTPIPGINPDTFQRYSAQQHPEKICRFIHRFRDQFYAAH